MELLTIGAFAKATRLSPKALRLYDELGLLPPARVDRDSGYRYYTAQQVEPARLVAWLRRLGMPLARIQKVLDADAGSAAREVSDFWREVVAETAGRERLATFLVDYLSGRASAMTTVGIRYAARTDQGRVRPTNADAAYAGGQLLAVADGVGGEQGGLASAAAIEALKGWQTRALPGDALLSTLADVVAGAREAVKETDGVTTLTAMLWAGSKLALVHIGDTRAYVLRDGGLFQITHDHTVVQSLVDEGKLTAAEAASHPQRAMLVRALSATGGHEPDLSVHDAQEGDRYLLCSDGLSAVVPDDVLARTLREHAEPEQAVDALIAVAHEHGAPDNIACVVADVVSPGPA